MVDVQMYRSPQGFASLPDLPEVRDVMECEGCLLWVDAETPTEPELAWIQQQFAIHPIAIEDYNSPEERSRIDRYSTFYSIVFFALQFDPKTHSLRERPLTLFIGQRFVVTLHADPFPEVQEARASWERKAEQTEPETGMALYRLLDALVEGYFPIIERLAEEVEEIEDQVLAHGKPTDLDKIFWIKRQYLYVRRAVAPERDVLNVLLRRELPLFSEQALIYLRDVQDHMVQVLDSLDTYRDLLAGALDVYVSVAVNHTMQVFTSWSIILMVASLIAAIYGMNFHYMPELNWRSGYEDALGMMVAIGAVLLVYFRWRKWL